MTFLPIVERELRVAARRPGTYWTRWFAALGMILVWVMLGAAIRKASPVEVSKAQFLALGILALGFWRQARFGLDRGLRYWISGAGTAEPRGSYPPPVPPTPRVLYA